MAIDKLGYVHNKIIAAGINTVVSVREDGLEFSKEATKEEELLAQTIFDGWSEEAQLKEEKIAKMVDIKQRLLAITEVEKDVEVFDKSALQLEYDALKTEVIKLDTEIVKVK